MIFLEVIGLLIGFVGMWWAWDILHNEACRVLQKASFDVPVREVFRRSSPDNIFGWACATASCAVVVFWMAWRIAT